MNAFSTWKAERLGCFFLLALSLSVRFSGKRQKVCFMLCQWSSDEDCVAADNSLVSISFRSFCIGFASFFFYLFRLLSVVESRFWDIVAKLCLLHCVRSVRQTELWKCAPNTEDKNQKAIIILRCDCTIGDCDGEKFKTKRNHCGKSPTEKAFKSTKMQENSAKESVRTSESAWK